MIVKGRAGRVKREPAPRSGDGRRGALDDGRRRRGDARRERPEGLAAVAIEPGRAEGVGDGLVSVADQQRSLQGDGHALDQPAGAELELGGVAEVLGEGRSEAIEPGLGARRLADIPDTALRLGPEWFLASAWQASAFGCGSVRT